MKFDKVDLVDSSTLRDLAQVEDFLAAELPLLNPDGSGRLPGRPRRLHAKRTGPGYLRRVLPRIPRSTVGFFRLAVSPHDSSGLLLGGGGLLLDAGRLLRAHYGGEFAVNI